MLFKKQLSHPEWKYGCYYQNYKITWNSGILIDRVSETVRRNKLKKQGGGFRGMLLGTLDVFT